MDTLEMPPQLRKLLDLEEISEQQAVHALLLWTLWRSSIDPMKTSPAQVAEMITALATYRDSGGGEDAGLTAFIGKLQALADS